MELHSTSTPENAELLRLLKEWKLEFLYHHFKAQNVTVEILKIIKIRHVERLLRNFAIGTQILFEHRLEIWRESIGAPLLNMCTESELLRPMRFPPRNSKSPPTSNRSSVCSTPDTDPEFEVDNSKPQPSLSTILNNSTKGRQLVEFYEKSKILKDEHRLTLISIIGEYFDQQQIHLSLGNTYELEQEIIKKFPSERLEFYRTGKRGRIYNKYANLKSNSKQLFMNADMSSVSNKDDAVSNKDDASMNILVLEPEEDAEMVVNMLKNYKLSIEEFMRCWKACSKYRISGIKQAETTLEGLQNWPEYKLPSGYKLIDIDFAVLFPNTQSLVETWEVEGEKLKEVLLTEGFICSKYIKEMLYDLNYVSKNSQDLCILWASHGCLVPWQKVVKTGPDGKKKVTRYTIKDSQNSFLMLHTSIEALEASIRCLIAEKMPIKPLLMVVGKDLKNIKEIFVYFNGVKYEFDSVIRALDICFKIYHVFNLEYPKPSVTFWTFIETYFYKFISQNNFSKVSILCSALENK